MNSSCCKCGGFGESWIKVSINNRPEEYKMICKKCFFDPELKRKRVAA